MKIAPLYLTAALGVVTALLPSHEAEARENPSIDTTEGFEPVKSGIINTDPDQYTIDVAYFRNLGVDKTAETFVFHTSNKVPDTCADLRGIRYKAEQPSTYSYQFDLESDDPMIDCVERYGCVVLNNTDLVFE